MERGIDPPLKRGPADEAAAAGAAEPLCPPDAAGAEEPPPLPRAQELPAAKLTATEIRIPRKLFIDTSLTNKTILRSFGCGVLSRF
jgi:hypothetical protein